MSDIHPTAVVHPGAELGEDVTIGPYCIIGEHVHLGDRSKLMSHVVLDGFTTIGSGCTFYPFASIGTRTQDLKYEGGAPRVEIGNNTTIREYTTVNAATKDGDYTRVGSDCLLMACSHVAHDCIVGDEVIIANCGLLAGHVTIGSQTIIGGLAGVHQFVRIGSLAIIGACSKVTQDVPPYMMADGHPLRVRGINRVGLDRRGYSKDLQKNIKDSFRILYRQDLSTTQAVETIRGTLTSSPELEQMLKFIEDSARGISKS